MKVFSYEDAKAVAEHKPSGYLAEIEKYGERFSRDGREFVRIMDQDYKTIASKYAPTCVWSSKSRPDGLWFHECAKCGKRFVSETLDVPEGVCNPRKKPNDPPLGVGYQVKRLLSMVGIKATKNCSCNKKAKDIDRRGLRWAKKNRQAIVGMLEDEAIRRGIPFSRFAAKRLVDLAILTAPKSSLP